MSRTYRRTNESAPRWVTHDWLVEKGVRWGSWVRVPLEGKALAKALARHHSDAGYSNHRRRPSKWFRNNEEKQQRMQNRCELERFYKDFEYEVMAEAKKKLPYWD